jgi:hypothetical protein
VLTTARAGADTKAGLAEHGARVAQFAKEAHLDVLDGPAL